jgi:hypothetical protein
MSLNPSSLPKLDEQQASVIRSQSYAHKIAGYNAAGSLARFENKNNIFYFL